MSTIAVIVPVLQRPHRVRPLIDSFHEATSPKDATLYFIAQRSDMVEIEAIIAAGLTPIVVEDVDRSWAKKINRGYERTSEPWLLLGADDLAFRPGWVDVIRRLLVSHPGVIGTNDLGNSGTIDGTHSTHPLVRRSYADQLGTADEKRRICHEGYHHNYPDTEIVATARKRGLYLHEARCVIEHLHPAWGKSQHDAVYALGQSRVAQDHALFMSRKQRFGW